MLQARHIAIAAMLRMERFTVAELHGACDVNVGTIQTLLSRRPELFEVVETRDTGRRGGRPKVYRVRPDARVALKEELSMFSFADVSGLNKDPKAPFANFTLEEEESPAELRVAEVLLDELEGDCSESERLSKIRQVDDYLRAAESIIRDQPSGSAMRSAAGRLFAASMKAALGGLDPFLKPSGQGERPPVMVGASAWEVGDIARQVQIALSTVLHGYSIEVEYADADEVRDKLPKEENVEPNIVVLPIDSNSADVNAEVLELVRECAEYSLVVVVDIGRQDGLSAEITALGGHYVSGARLLGTRLLKEMSMIAVEERDVLERAVS